MLVSTRHKTTVQCLQILLHWPNSRRHKIKLKMNLTEKNIVFLFPNIVDITKSDIVNALQYLLCANSLCQVISIGAYLMLKKNSVNQKGSDVLFLPMKLKRIRLKSIIHCKYKMPQEIFSGPTTHPIFHRLLHQGETLPTRVKLMFVGTFEVH